MSKGSHRRPEDAAAIRRNWPFSEPARSQMVGYDADEVDARRAMARLPERPPVVPPPPARDA